MSLHVEWMDAALVRAEIAYGGNHVGENAVDDDRVALVLSVDEAVAIEGSPEALRSLHLQIGRVVATVAEGIPTPRGVLLAELRAWRAFGVAMRSDFDTRSVPAVALEALLGAAEQATTESGDLS